MKLGTTQANVLRSLVTNRSVEGGARWTPHCGWVWNTVYGTQKLLDGLVRKGLVKVDIEQNTSGWSLRGKEYPVYTPTDAGWAWVKENPR